LLSQQRSDILAAMKNLFLVSAVVVLLVAPLFASNVSGTWEAKVVVGAQNGAPIFVLQQKGEKLSGTYKGTLGDAPVTGTAKGQNIVLEFQASGLKVIYSGKLSADGKKMEGTVDYGGQASGTFTAIKKPVKAK
jgi:hypothetical protein